MNNEIKDKDLLEDIKKLDKNKMKNIKNVDEIPILSFKIKKGMIGSDSYLHESFCILKKVLQITINVYNRYDIYKDFVFKFHRKDKNQRLSLEDYCVYDEKNDVWKCKSEPKESHLEDALYNYIYCFLSIQMKENVYNKDKMIEILNCTFCDSAISQGKDRCEVCDTPLSEMGVNNINRSYQEIKLAKKNININTNSGFNSENLYKWKCGRCECMNEYTFINCKVCEGVYKDGKWNCGKCTIENCCNDNKCSECGEDNYNMKREDRINDEKSDFLKNENDMKEFTNNNNEIEENKSDDKWKCGRCECLNEYIFINCKVCEGLYKDGKWNCGKCTMENSCVDNKCSECGDVNLYMKEKDFCDKCGTQKNRGYKDCDKCNPINKDNEVKIYNDQWECGRCGVLQLYNFTVCNACNGSRFVYGLWKCTQCTMINKCYNTQCAACSVKNYSLLKYCKRCWNSKVEMSKVGCDECAHWIYEGGDTIWKCPFNNCKEWNVENYDYCQKCKIYCYSSQTRGEPVKLYNQERYVWICYTCNRHNELNNFECECGEKRYDNGIVSKLYNYFVG